MILLTCGFLFSRFGVRPQTAFLTSFQVQMLVQGPHLEEQGSKFKSAIDSMEEPGYPVMSGRE